MKLHDIINEVNTSKSGYQGLSTRLRRDTGKNISWKTIKKYLKKKDKSDAVKDVTARSKSKKDPDAYKYTAIYNMIKGHFTK